MRWLIVTGIVLAVPGVAFGQGLGGAAQKEAERRKANAASGVKARSVDIETLRTDTGSGKGTFSTTGVATTNEESPAASDGKPKPVSETSSSGRRSEPSGTEVLQRKIETWRGRYRPVKASVDSLEVEVADLEARESRIAGIATDKTTYRDPNLRTEAERTVERLPKAREQLARARQRLAEIEEGARRDGVSTGQLF